MTEEEAKQWLRLNLDVPRETFARLEAFAALVREENARQNLVARSTLDQLWARHIVDSAQLVRFAPSSDAAWLDLGSGPGFPGLIVAALRSGPVALVEERKRRCEFLREGARLFHVEHRVEVICARLERVPPRPFGVISARAFAPLERLFALATPFSTTNTRWVLPKGRNAQSELEAARASWQGDFRLEASLTDRDAMIIVAEGVRRRPRGRAQ